MEALKGNLIVSCQALEDEPLHSSYIMSKMALAARIGGAKGIRANSVEDIHAIKQEVDLPIIGIIKKEYPDSNVYITPTMKEVEALANEGVEIIAVDATNRIRPQGKSLERFYHEIKSKYPNQKLMADCSTLEECIFADTLGFDYIGTTMIGYTKESQHLKIEDNDFEILKQIIHFVQHPVVCEGNIDTPDKAKRVIELGAYFVVVGGAITRPQNITKRFVQKMKRSEEV